MRVKIDRRAADQVAEQMLFNKLRGYTEPAAEGLEAEAILNLIQIHLSRAASCRERKRSDEDFRTEMVNVAALAFEAMAMIDAGREDPHPIGPSADQRGRF